MSTEANCNEFREVAPELALGIADGEERARALEHLARCGECRRVLDELATATDELLMLAPEQEPPLGFEDRVIAATRPAPAARVPFFRRPVFAFGTAVLATAALVAGGMALVYKDDHDLASSYRQTLSAGKGTYFTASALRAPGGHGVGQVFGYEGKPSFVVVTLNDWDRKLPDGNYDCQFVTADGTATSFGKLTLSGGEGSYGRATATNLDDVREVRLLGPGKGTVLEAQLKHGRAEAS